MREYIVHVRIAGVGPVRVWAETRHKAKAHVVRELMARGYAFEFKRACNQLIASCRLMRP